MLNSLTVPPPSPVDRSAYAEILTLLRRGDVAVLTGAGMSTASGIPDYRGPDGQRRVQPMQYAEFLADREGRRRYWARAYAGWDRFAAASPNASHRSVARIQAQGALSGIITQNVDGLHQGAGASDVIELHGNLGRVECLDCARLFGREDVHAWLRSANPSFRGGADEIVRPDGDVVLSDEVVARFTLANCPHCGSDRLKPDVVFFGGAVARPLVDQSFALVERSSALLVLGSSLQVMSGYRFVRRAAALGIPVAVITRGPTRGDAQTTIRVDALLEDVLPGLAVALES
ncbi:MAG: Sir2 family NAD-dependent protein deacetylase [Ornithinimicrobium sp.]